MEIEKKLVVSAPRDAVWAMLMDPHVMTGAVPGMQSIDVISPTEYVALMKVKISFISAKFKLHTNIVEQREPEYLRAEGTGEDTSVASSLKQTSEVFLTEAPDGGTELRIKVNVDLLGRLGTFGLSVMKTKADRMWDEFGKNLTERLEGGGQAPQTEAVIEPTAIAAEAVSIEQEGRLGGVAAPSVAATSQQGASSVSAAGSDSRAFEEPQSKGWFSRLLTGKRVSVGNVSTSASRVIRVEVRQMDRTVSIEWPVEAADQCQEWLRELLTRPN